MELRFWTLLLQHGADVNAQVTGTKTYSMRIARSPSTNEGMTALHVAAQSGRADLVRYLLEKGANPEIVDSNGRKAIDLVGGARAGNAAAPATAVRPAEVGAVLKLQPPARPRFVPCWRTQPPGSNQNLREV